MMGLLTACATTGNGGSGKTLSGEWTIESIHGTAVDKNAGDHIPFLGFDRAKKIVYGSTGCNRLTGGWDPKAETLDTKRLACTRMMCADMTNETRVLEALGEVEKYHIDNNGTLLLTDGNGKTVMELKKK